MWSSKAKESENQINKGLEHKTQNTEARERKESIEQSLAAQSLQGLVRCQRSDIPMWFLISLSSCDCYWRNAVDGTCSSFCTHME